MIKIKPLIIVISFLLCFSCDDESGDQNPLNIIEIITTNINQGDFLFNFETG